MWRRVGDTEEKKRHRQEEMHPGRPVADFILTGDLHGAAGHPAGGAGAASRRGVAELRDGAGVVYVHYAAVIDWV